MVCIVVEKGKFVSMTYDNVTNVAYNTSTGICTITYNNGQTVNYSARTYYIYVRNVM